MTSDKRQTARVLIIEDEPVLALTLEELLIDAGFAVTGVAYKLDKALALVNGGACDVAIVDANLAGVSASPVATLLAERGLPYIVMSGYSPQQMQGHYPEAIFLSKPCRPEFLIETLNTILLPRQS